MDKLISIVLPTYNGEKYIQDSIESVLTQTYKNWELIIVNDCSQDNTSQIINKYAQKDSRIKIINNEVNKKLPASLNIGFENAQGDYYTWTSDDNMYKPDALMYMTEFLDNNPQIALIACDFDMVQEGNEDKITKYSDTNPDNRTVLGNIFCSNIGACFMYRKEIAKKIGKYDEKMFCAEDLDYWCRLMLISEVHYSNENFYTYRFTKTSLTATRQKEIKARVRDIQEKYAIPVMKKLGLRNKEICKNLYKLHKESNSIKLLLEIYKINLFYALYYTLKSLARIIIQKTFSIKNINNKKVITILGFKIKIKRKVKKRYCTKKNEQKLNNKNWGNIYNNQQIIENTIKRIKEKNNTSWTNELLKIIPTGSKTLELGCGNAQSSITLALNGCIPTVVDFSEECLDAATNISQKANVNITTVLADIQQNLPFNENEFDYIFHAGLLEHFTKKERIKLLKQWRPYAKTMISMVPNAASLAYRVGKHQLEQTNRWQYGFETPLYTQIDEFIQAGYLVKKEYTIGLKDALVFLDGNKQLKKILSLMIENKELSDDYHQGYLLVTIGESINNI